MDTLEANRITLRLFKNIDKKLSKLSKEKNTSKNEMINILLAIILNNEENKLMKFDYFTNKKEHKYTIFLSNKEKEFLEKRAIEHGFNSVTSEIRYRLLNTIYDDKFFTNIEIQYLLQTLNDINKVGRNINSLLENARKTDNYNYEINYPKLKNELIDISKNIKNITNFITNANLRIRKRK